MFYAVQKEQQKMTKKKAKKQDDKLSFEEVKEGKSAALFEQLMETPMTFTLDQLLSLTPIFRDKFYSVARNSSSPLVPQKF